MKLHLQKELDKLMEWFDGNGLKSNTAKNMFVDIRKTEAISNAKCFGKHARPLGATIDKPIRTDKLRGRDNKET